MEETQESKLGASAHIETDTPTLNDSLKLGYNEYARAIARFLTHPMTEPPVSIGIDSPGGAGKTSLMRMVQSQLDTTAANMTKDDKIPISWSQSKATVTSSQDVMHQLRKGQELKNIDVDIPIKSEKGISPCITIWFEAWKYENAEQVWAGLADTISKQIAEHLKPQTSELFWIELFVKRLNADRIRRVIYDKILTQWWWNNIPTMWKSLIGKSIIGIGISTIISIIGILQNDQLLPKIGWAGIAVSIAIGIFTIFREYTEAKSKTDYKSTLSGLDGYADIPDYNAALGFIHQVKRDVQMILNTITKRYQIVIFINDLHRCPPTKLAEVTLAIRNFVEEFRTFMYVIGMDSRKVVSAIEEANKILPSPSRYSKEFMDKFVQLPFLIPPYKDDSLTTFISSHLDRQQADVVTDVDTIIDGYSTEDKQIWANIQEAVNFVRPSTPRELTRLINVFRFQYFLRAARLSNHLPVPSLLQLTYWTILLVRWPDVIRWLQWQPGEPTSIAESRLMKLEGLGRTCNTLDEWRTSAEKTLQLKPDEFPWLLDDEIKMFFGRIGSYEKEERLSALRGRGLY